MELYFGEPNNLAWDNAELKDSGDVYKTIPLYTHPAKTLTDEEIIEIWSGMETDTGEQNIIFVRAILRKAQDNG